MKKILIGLAVLGGLYYAFGQKKTATASTLPGTQNNDVSNLNGKIVINDDNGNWLAIIDNKAYFTANVQAIADFQAKYGNSEPIHVTSAELVNYPISGSLWENLELK